MHNTFKWILFLVWIYCLSSTVILSYVTQGLNVRNNITTTFIWITLFLILAQMIYYTIHVTRTIKLTKNNKALWVIFLLYGNVIAFPFYWFMNIRKINISNGGSADFKKLTVHDRRSKSAFSKMMILIVGLIPILLIILSVFIRTTEPSNNMYFILGITAYILITGLIIYYIANTAHNKSLTRSSKMLWIVVFILANIVAFPIYWYQYIREKPEEPLGYVMH